MRRIRRRSGPEQAAVFRTRWIPLEEQYFAESKKENGESKPAEQSRSAAAQNKPAKKMGLAEQEGFYPIDETIEDDDLPF